MYRPRAAGTEHSVVEGHLYLYRRGELGRGFLKISILAMKYTSTHTNKMLQLTAEDYQVVDNGAADRGKTGTRIPESHAQGHGVSFRFCA